MSNQTITNPLGVNQTVSDHRTARDIVGGEVAYGKTVRPFRANANITRGQAVSFVVPTETVPLSVTPTTAAGSHTFAGIAEDTVLAGRTVNVVVEGLAFAIAGDTIAAGNAVGAVADGEVEAVTIAATTLVGAVAGVALAAASSTDEVPILVKHL